MRGWLWPWSRGRRRADTLAGLAGLIGLIGLLGLTFAAYVADLGRPLASHGTAALDVGVGLSFVVAAVASRCGVRQRILVVLVGACWLLASLAPVASWHQAALVVVLLAFPDGRPGSSARALVGLLVALALLPGLAAQSLTAAGFALLAVLVATDRTRATEARVYASSAAGAVAVVLAVSSFLRDQGTGPGSEVLLAAYQAVLVAVALGHVAATRWVGIRSRSRLGRLLAPHPDESRGRRIEVFEAVLAESVADPHVRVDFLEADTRSRVGAPPDLQWRNVHDGGDVVAAVGFSRTPDPVSVRAVDEAVRLVARSLRLLADSDLQLARRAAVRDRLLRTEERQRQWLATRVQDDVLVPLDRAREKLQAVGGGSSASSSLSVVLDQLTAAGTEMHGLVRGVPPVPLGHGALRDLLGDPGAWPPTPFSAEVAGDAVGDIEAETTLYYVLTEALVNVSKHAGARRTSVTLRRRGGWLEAVVSDDGRGGADPRGSGLLGLVDRLAACGGSLSIDTEPSVGTILCARVPTRSSSRAR